MLIARASGGLPGHGGGFEASEAVGGSGVAVGPHQHPGEPYTREDGGGALAYVDHTRELFGASEESGGRSEGPGYALALPA